MIRGPNAISIVSATTQLPVMKKGYFPLETVGRLLGWRSNCEQVNAHGKQKGCGDTLEQEIKCLHADSQAEDHTKL